MHRKGIALHFAIAVTLAASACSSASEEQPVAVDRADQAVTWEEPTSVIGGDNDPTIVFTGTHVLILNTENWGSDIIGERWDPATGEVESIGRTKLAWRVNPATAWTGDELIMLGGSNGPGMERVAVAYDPDDDSWRDLAPPPGASEFNPGVGGPGFLIDNRVIIPRRELAYEVEEDSWNSLAPWPYSDTRLVRTIVSAGDNIVAWGGCEGELCDDSNNGLLSGGMIYDTTEDVWRPMSEGPLPPSVENAAAWTGSELVIVAMVPEDGKPKAAAYDPATDDWRELPDPPVGPSRGAAALASDHRIILLSNNTNDAALFNLESESWESLPDAIYPMQRPVMADFGDGIYISGTRPDTPVERGDTGPQLLFFSE